MSDDPDPSGAAAGYAAWALLGLVAGLAYLTISTFFEPEQTRHDRAAQEIHDRGI